MLKFYYVPVNGMIVRGPNVGIVFFFTYNYSVYIEESFFDTTHIVFIEIEKEYVTVPKYFFAFVVIVVNRSNYLNFSSIYCKCRI